MAGSSEYNGGTQGSRLRRVAEWTHHVADEEEGGPEADGSVGEDGGEDFKPPLDIANRDPEHGHKSPAERAELSRRGVSVEGGTDDGVCRGRGIVGVSGHARAQAESR
jgi:hypothetical protein